MECNLTKKKKYIYIYIYISVIINLIFILKVIQALLKLAWFPHEVIADCCWYVCAQLFQLNTNGTIAAGRLGCLLCLPWIINMFEPLLSKHFNIDQLYRILRIAAVQTNVEHTFNKQSLLNLKPISASTSQM